MTKRVSLTFLSFLVLDFFVIMLFSNIGLFPKVTLRELMVFAVVYAIFYLIFVFSATRKHPYITLFIILGILLVITILPSGKEVETSGKVIDIKQTISGAFIMYAQLYVAYRQGKIYKEEKFWKQVQKDKEKLEYEEVAPDGSVTRKGIIKNY